MKDMTKGSPLRLILAFALPLLLGNILQQCYNIADAAIVGRFLGSGALAAVGATSSVQLMILGFCTGACAGFCVPIAQRFGAQDYKGMRSLLYNSILLVGILSAGLTVLCVLLTNIILHILSIPVDIWDNTYIYILIIFLGIPFTLLYNQDVVIRNIEDYSVMKYMLYRFTANDASELERALMKAALDYGAVAQEYFDSKYETNVGHLANATTNPSNVIVATRPTQAAVYSNTIESISDASANMVYDSVNYIRFRLNTQMSWRMKKAFML